MTMTAFDHYTVRTADLQKSWRFYEEILGLDVVEREGAAVPAAIVSVAGTQVVHLWQATPEQDAVFARQEPKDEETAAWRTGRVQHVGFWATGITNMREKLTLNGIAHREITRPDKHQFIIHDPDGLEIEVNFPLAELNQ